MCSDLISRRMVMEFLQQRHAGALIEGCHAEPAMEEVYGGIQSEVGRIMDFIVQAPDAYDVDKVAGQLRELNENEFTYARVMHIVKEGGVDG